MTSKSGGVRGIPGGRGGVHTGRMRRILAAIALAAPLALAACAPPPVREPVTVTANDLQGETVRVALDQIIAINTGDLAVDSYSAEVDDPSIARFEQGRIDGGTEYNPGFTPLKVGSTEVTLTNEQGGIQPLQFTIEVVEAQG